MNWCKMASATSDKLWTLSDTRSCGSSKSRRNQSDLWTLIEFHQAHQKALKIRAQAQWIHTLRNSTLTASARLRIVTRSNSSHIAAFWLYSIVFPLYSLYDFDFMWVTRHCSTFTAMEMAPNWLHNATHIHNLYSDYYSWLTDESQHILRKWAWAPCVSAPDRGQWTTKTSIWKTWSISRYQQYHTCTSCTIWKKCMHMFPYA